MSTDRLSFLAVPLSPHAEAQTAVREGISDLVRFTARYEEAKTGVLRKYPELREALERSFLTPQLGKYHNEGETMEAHLMLILQAIDRVKAGEIDPAIEEEFLRALILDTVRENGDAFEEYTFFHDIKKPDTLVLTPEGDFRDSDKQEISWEEWQALQAKGKPYTMTIPEIRTPVTKIAYFKGETKKRVEVSGLDFDLADDLHARPEDGIVLNPGPKGTGISVTLAEWDAIRAAGEPYVYIRSAQSVPVATIGYFHNSKGEEGAHGFLSAKFLKETLGDHSPAPLILDAIRLHESPFRDFGNGISAKIFQERYGALSDEQIHFALTASYLDFSGSLGENGHSDYKHLLCMFHSWRNLRLIQRFLASGAQIRENDLGKLYSATKPLTPEDVEAVRGKLKVYSREELTAALQPVDISPDQKEQVVALLSTGQPVDARSILGTTLGQALKQKMPSVQQAVALCGVDSFKLS